MLLIRNLSTEQARELCLLVDLEATWENARHGSSVAQSLSLNVKELQRKQHAYEVFHSKLVAYNKGFRPAHVPELLLNTADRLGAWCRDMIDLLRAAQTSFPAYYPAHLIEKAYRHAERLSGQRAVEHVSRPILSRDTAGAVQELERLAQWCECLTPSTLAG